MKRSILKAVGIATSAALALSACGSDGSDKATEPVIGGTLVDLQNFSDGTPPHIDPALSTDASSNQLVAILFDGLTATNEAGNIVGAVASSYSANDDATVWTFKLRDDVHFNDGSKVMPSSFKRGWQRVVNPALESEVATNLAELQLTEGDSKLDNVVADDAAHTLKVTLAHPDRDFPSLVSTTTFSPMPESAPMDKPLDGVAMVGNGPFKMDSPMQAGQSIVVSRNPSYYGGPDDKAPNVDKIEFRIFNDLETAYSEFGAGKGQIGRFPSTATADLQKYQKDDIINTPLMGVEFWGFNMNDPVFGGPENQKLRQAINIAVDKAAINQQSYGGTREIAAQFSSPSTPGSGAKPSDGRPDVDTAKKLLKDWGKTPPALKVSFNSGGGHEAKVATMVQNFNAIGIPAVADPMDIETYRTKFVAGELSFFRLGWSAANPSYRSMIEPMFMSSSSDNVLGYKNTNVDKLFNDAVKEPSIDKRNGEYRDAEKLIMDDGVIVPVTWDTANLIKDPKVKNMKADVLGYINYDQLWLAHQ